VCGVVWCIVGSRRRLTILILSLCFLFMGLLLISRQLLLGSSSCRHMGNRKSGVSFFRHCLVSFTDFVWSLLSSFASSRHRRVVVFLFLVSLGCALDHLHTVCGVCRVRVLSQVSLTILYDKPFLRRCEVLCFEQTMSHIRFCLFVVCGFAGGRGGCPRRYSRLVPTLRGRAMT
jgi:hypothetical protein